MIVSGRLPTTSIATRCGSSSQTRQRRCDGALLVGRLEQRDALGHERLERLADAPRRVAVGHEDRREVGAHGAQDGEAAGLGAVQRALVAPHAAGRVRLEPQRGDQARAAAAHAVGPARVLLEPVHARAAARARRPARGARPRACRRPRAPRRAPAGSGARRCTGCDRAAGGADPRRSRRTAATRRRPADAIGARSGGRGTAVSPRALVPARTPWEGSPDAMSGQGPAARPETGLVRPDVDS